MLGTADYKSLIREIDRLEASVSEHYRAKVLHLDQQRIVADLRVLATHKKRQPIKESEALYQARVKLGFRTLVDEAVSASAHARYCLKSGEAALAAKHARAMLRKARSSPMAKGISLHPEIEKVLLSLAKDAR